MLMKHATHEVVCSHTTHMLKKNHHYIVAEGGKEDEG